MINDALRLLRLYFGMSQQEIAEAVGVSQSLVSDVEASRKNVSLDLLDKYSRSLGIKMSQLLFFAEEIEGEPLKRRGNLFIADRVLKILELIKPSDRVDA